MQIIVMASVRLIDKAKANSCAINDSAGGGKALFFLKKIQPFFYDVVSKRKLPAIPLAGVIGAQWSEKERVLFVETMPLASENTPSRWRLHAYKIEYLGRFQWTPSSDSRRIRSQIALGYAAPGCRIQSRRLHSG